MDADGFPLATISEKSVTDDSITSVKPIKGGKRAPLPPTDSNSGLENGHISTSSSTTMSVSRADQPAVLNTYLRSEQSTGRTSTNSEQTRKYNQVEVNSIQDEDDEKEREDKFVLQRPSEIINDRDSTMVSSYATGGENDVIEIHQFSLADVDAYLDIYFETLNHRLRHYIGQDEQLQQFRVAMKSRINSNPNAREFQNVLLGKMNGEVLAAITMSFPGETPTITQPPNTPQQNSCLTSIRRWMTQKANYVPTNNEECYIEMIGVKSGYRNHGIGAAMLECVEQFARQAGANRLTIHTHGQQLRHYFERYGFTVDTTDSSAFWKWILERQGNEKLVKTLAQDEDNDYAANSYINESMVDSIEGS